MKQYLNSNGDVIFFLDDNGNATFKGNVTLGVDGILTAKTINAVNNDAIAVIQDPERMGPVYTESAGVVYYIGPTTPEYEVGTFWKKVVAGFGLSVVEDSNADSEFIIYNKDFEVSEESNSHIFNLLKTYPSTVKIVFNIVKAEEDEHAHWEVVYFNALDEELYTDVVNTNFLYDSEYQMPFTPLNADDYDEGYTSIEILSEPIYVLELIKPSESDLYMPLIGGTFEGVINTQNVVPAIHDTYNIGTPSGRYKAGYFSLVDADIIRSRAIAIEQLVLEELKIDDEKSPITPGDSLLINDGQTGTVKRAPSLNFTASKTQFLRKDGVFAEPKTSLKTVTDMSKVVWEEGQQYLYNGEKVGIYTPETIYIAAPSITSYQINFEGVELSKVSNAGIFVKTNLNNGSPLISALNGLGIGTVGSIIESESSITLVYSDTIKGWYIEGKRDKGVISKETTLAEYTNIELISSIITNNKTFTISTVSPTEIKVKITKKVWEPVNPIRFDGITSNQYLSKAGTWEPIPTGGDTPSAGGMSVIYGSIDLVGSKVSVTGMDDQVTSGLYEFKGVDVSAGQSYIARIQRPSNTSIVQVIDYLGDPVDVFKVYDYPFTKISRTGVIGLGNAITWSNWTVYKEVPQQCIKTESAETWRTITYDEFNYLLYTRDNAEDLVSKCTLGTVPGILILPDDWVSPEGVTIEPTLDDFTTNTFDFETWDIMEEAGAIFLPISGQRLGTYVSNYIGSDTPTGVYWLGTADATDIEKAYSFAFSNVLFSLTNLFGKQSGFSVRLVRTTNAGRFSVSDTKTISFAPGNLQYQASTDTWRFAEKQYETIGIYNGNISESYNGWIDLFGFGTSGHNNKYGYMTSEDALDYGNGLNNISNTKYDWGVNNPIQTIRSQFYENAILDPTLGKIGQFLQKTTRGVQWADTPLSTLTNAQKNLLMRLIENGEALLALL